MPWEPLRGSDARSARAACAFYLSATCVLPALGFMVQKHAEPCSKAGVFEVPPTVSEVSEGEILLLPPFSAWEATDLFAGRRQVKALFLQCRK